VWLGCNSKLRVCLVVHTQLVLAHSLLENDLHARAQILAGVRRGRISFLGRWDGSGGITRDNYLTPTSPDVTATAPYPNLPRLPVSRAMADGTLESQVGARIWNGLGIMRACLETQKLEQLEARMDEIADRVVRDRTNAARERSRHP
jgi:hypothetical protein